MTSMPDMTTALRHLVWADARLLSEPIWDVPEALTYATGEGERTMAELIAHIVDGAQWYRYCLTAAPMLEISAPRNRTDVDQLNHELASLNNSLLAQASSADEALIVDDGGRELRVTRAMILAQACYHSTEHRSQIDSALRAGGFTGLDLDSYDLWTFLDD